MAVSMTRSVDLRVLLVLLLFCLRSLQRFFKQESIELFSELLCWSCLTLAAVIWLRQQVLPLQSEDRNHFPQTHIWCIATGLVISSWCRTYVLSAWVWPILTFAFFFIGQTRTSFLPVFIGNEEKSNTIRTWLLPSAATSFCFFVLFEKSSAFSQSISIMFLFAQCAIYVPLESIAKRQTQPSTVDEVMRLVVAVGIRTSLAIGLLFGWKVLSGEYSVDMLPSTFFMGVVKCIQWWILLSILDEPPWTTIATAGTFSSSAFAIYIIANDLTKSFACLGAAFFALNQTINMLPAKGYKGASLLYLLLLIPILLLWQRSASMTLSPSRLSWPLSHVTPTIEADLKDQITAMEADDFSKQHPVEVLAHHYQRQLDAMLSRQSTTYKDAAVEYRRRYLREPPPGFEGWLNYARKHESLLIDDFDSIEESLRTIRSQEPSKIRELVKSAINSGGARVFSCDTRGGKFNGDGCQWMGGEITELLADVTESLPDTDLVLNTLDEPRVLADLANHDTVDWIDESRRSTWSRITEKCASAQTSRYAENAPLKDELYDLPFVWDAIEAKDLCVHPEYSSLHGFFEAPSTFVYTRSAVPILSPAKPSTFGDILYPPPYYMGMYDQGKYQESDDPEWDEKRNKLYWAGSTTGSHASDQNWRQAHRQRFVSRVNQLYNDSTTFLTETSPGVWDAYESQEVYSQLYDAKFTAIIQCESTQCAEEASYFHPEDREGGSAGMQYKFIFDLDGNSFSGRYYTLLASRSVVFKQTIFREWHDERLMPWVHYVPISLDMGELPEVMRYLALTKKGGERAKAIANNGREWLAKALRKEDAAIYMYRLLLELGRLMDNGD